MSDNKNDFGVLYGQKTTGDGDSLLIYSSYEDSKKSPQTGDFIVLTPRDEDGNKYLARVEAEIYDEDPIFRSQDKTLVAVHYARVAERDLSARDKQKMFSYTYKVNILGKFSGDGKNFNTAVRRLPFVSYHARHLQPREFENIINKSNENGQEIGKLCIGDEIQLQGKNILFDVNKLKSKRTMVFAQSGFGKTNLIKTLLLGAIPDKSVGKLIFDLEGEYAFKSQNNHGLTDIDDPNFLNNLIVYTDKNLSNAYQKNFKKGNVKIDLSKDFQIDDILHSAVGLTSAGKTFLEFVASDPDKGAVSEFIRLIVNGADNQSIRKHAYQKFSSYLKESGKKHQANDNDEPDMSQANKSMLGGVIRQIRAFTSIHENSSNLIEDILKYLQEGRTVIIDMSNKDNSEASIIASTLTKRLFEHNKTSHTDDSFQPINTVIFVEEAQNVLSDEFVRSNANTFVKIAKQGRKFSIGLVAITQRPSSISEEIRSQAENYFVMHMSNSKDIKALVESNNNYRGVISSFIQNEPISGNLYMVSSGQSFVVPARVNWFEKTIENRVHESQKFEKQFYEPK